METKTCKICGRDYPATTEFFHKDAAGNLGLKAFCKKCKNGEKFRFVEKGNHLCKSCERELPYTEEYFVPNPKSGNLTSPCRECRGLRFGQPRYKKVVETCPSGKKICIKCRKIFPLTSIYFLRRCKSKDGFSPRCRECDKTKFKDYIPITGEDEKFCNKCKTVKKKTEFCKDSSKTGNLSTTCRDCHKRYSQITKNIRNKRNKHRKEIDPAFKVLCLLRSRVHAAIKQNVKSKTTITLLGCSVEYFIKYLEDKFSKEMNWTNHGKCWHIDHIIPCYYFNLLLEEDQLKCFNYTNMQPMFAADNLSKQKYSSTKVIYKTSNDFKNNDYSHSENYIVDER